MDVEQAINLFQKGDMSQSELSKFLEQNIDSLDESIAEIAEEMILDNEYCVIYKKYESEFVTLAGKLDNILKTKNKV